MNDDQKHQQAEAADEEMQDEVSPLGSMTADTEDIDATLESVGLQSDDNGPHELNSQEIMDKADKIQE